MRNLIKLIQAVIILLAISINLGQSTSSSSSTNYTCNLDDMKLFAAEACENIFIENDADIRENLMREKRELWKSKYHNEIGNESGDRHVHPKFSYKAHFVDVRRKDYPHGGFIRINRAHAKILTHKNNSYKILDHKMHSSDKMIYSSDKGYYRGKRQNYDNIIHIPYCCTNNCRTDFFCRR